MAKVAKIQRYKFNLVKKNGQHVSWSGLFLSLELALNWHAKYGKWHENRGHKLAIAKCKATEIN